MNQKYSLFALVTLIFVVLDQATKIWVFRNIAYRTEEIELIPGFLSLVHAQNTGAAGGFLGDNEYRMVIFAVFTVVAVGVLLHMLWELPQDDRFQTTALGLIMSGAVGNAIDRVHKQSVTDFVRVYTEHESLKPWLIEQFGTYEWPSFNVADAAIVVGLGLFGVHYLFLQEDDPEVEPSPGEADEDGAPEEDSAGASGETPHPPEAKARAASES